MSQVSPLNEQRKSKLVQLCRRLVRIPSPSGQEGEMARTVRDLAAELGYQQIDIDAFGNVVACISGNRPGRTLLLDAHMDTVPVTDEDEWEYSPFGGEVVSGRLYGRGSSDMKGALAAMLLAGAMFSRDTNGEFCGEICVAATVMEEVFEGVAARSVVQAIEPDWVVIGESTGLDVSRGQRGRAEIVVETEGKAAHSSSPEAGHNAVYDMAELIGRIRQLPCPEDPVLGRGILELTDIISRPYPGASVIPHTCRATFDRRLLVGETPESALAPLLQTIDRLASERPGVSASARHVRAASDCWTGHKIEAVRFFPAWLFDSDHPLVVQTQRALRKVGLQPSVSHYSFCTNGSRYAGIEGVPTVGFGPSREEVAHTTDEYLLLDELYSSCSGYYSIIKTLTE